MKQFEKMDCSRGAPMGRSEYPTLPSQPKSVSLFKVYLDHDGYDDGGAYWGWPTHNLWCARTDDGEYRRFIRAPIRHLAAKELGIPQELLKRRTV